MKIRTGIDIIEVERIQESIEKYGDTFLNRVYTNKEIEYCNSKKVQKYQSFAGKFAVKEAVLKAISEEISNKFEISWKEIEVLNKNSGKPIVKLSDNLIEKIGQEFFIDVSISHVQKTAVANCIFGVYNN